MGEIESTGPCESFAGVSRRPPDEWTAGWRSSWLSTREVIAGFAAIVCGGVLVAGWLVVVAFLGIMLGMH